MKLSTKLLIALAVLFFIAPSLVASYFIRVTRVDADVYHSDVQREVSNAGVKDVYFRSIKVGKFDKLQLTGADAKGIDLHVVKSDQFLVKVSRNQADFVKSHVDEEGLLTLNFRSGGDVYYKSVYIFTPDLNLLKLKNASINEFSAKLDALTIIGDHIENFSLGGGSSIDRLNLILTNSKIDDLGSFDEKNTLPVGHLSVDATNTNVGLPRMDCQTATIHAKNSSVYFAGRKEKSSVGILDITTEGVSTIRLDSLQWKTLKGHLSNDTKIDLPMHALRNLIK